MVLNLMRKKLLAAAVMGAVGAAAGICTAGAADAAYVLDEVVVIGNRDEERDVLPGNFVYTKSQTSFLAGKDTMDVPFPRCISRKSRWTPLRGLISRWMRFWQTRRLCASPDLFFMVISFPRIPYKRNQLLCE